jgi:cyclohexa-1,5-dienecarbonyl-CoA hydratase
MSDYEKIRVEPFLDGHGLHVVLNAPKANVLDSAMMGEINRLLDSLETKNELKLKLICFSGEGKHFSFGASVEEHVGERAAAMLEGFHGMFLRMAKLGVPTAAAVRGQCLGGGLELAAFCNRVVAGHDAVLAQPEIQLAVLPPIASLILPFRIGQARADDVNLTGRNFGAEEARAIGLVDDIAEDPVATVEAWAAEQLGKKSAAALRCANRASRWHFNKVLSTEIKAMEHLYLEDLMGTHDANEGLTAFLAKRKPAWKHS